MSDTVTMTREQFDDLTSRLEKVENKSVASETTVRQCNVCGDLLPEDLAKCVKHPYDLTNEVGSDRLCKPVVVSQS